MQKKKRLLFQLVNSNIVDLQLLRENRVVDVAAKATECVVKNQVEVLVEWPIFPVGVWIFKHIERNAIDGNADLLAIPFKRVNMKRLLGVGGVYDFSDAVIVHPIKIFGVNIAENLVGFAADVLADIDFAIVGPQAIAVNLF